VRKTQKKGGGKMHFCAQMCTFWAPIKNVKKHTLAALKNCPLRNGLRILNGLRIFAMFTYPNFSIVFLTYFYQRKTRILRDFSLFSLKFDKFVFFYFCQKTHQKPFVGLLSTLSILPPVQAVYHINFWQKSSKMSCAKKTRKNVFLAIFNFQYYLRIFNLSC
jgi:hypothetical protein